MFLDELKEPQLLVIYPGRFQPFHKGHHAVYNYLAGKFGAQNVYIATSNKTDAVKSPFTFAEKSYFMQLTGVPAKHIVEATSPYQIDSVLQGGHIQVNNRQNTVVIFAVSKKDMEEDPRFASWTKKDGSPAYFQPLGNIKDTMSMDEHGYIMTVPTFDFTVLGQPMQSGTELRKQYEQADEKTRQLIVKDLFGRYTREAEQIMSNKLAPKAITPPEPVVAKKAKLQKVKAVAEGTAFAQQDFDTQMGLARLKNQLHTQQPEQPKPESLASLQARRAKLQQVIDLKGQLEVLLKRAERVPGGMDRGIQADMEIDYPNPTTEKECDELISLYTRQVQQIQNYIKRKRAIYREAHNRIMFTEQELNEEAAGVGVVAGKSQAKDPRYCMSLTKDVRPGQINKSLKAFSLK